MLHVWGVNYSQPAAIWHDVFYEEILYNRDNWSFNALSVGGRLAEHIENLLPPHPQGCPAEVPAERDCFIAGLNTCILLDEF